MFGKHKGMATIIGRESEFTGQIVSKGTLRVDGKINGQVNADYVILSETASVKGDVTARGVIIGGRLEGNVAAREGVEIKSTGKIWGEIFTDKICIAEGGVFNGKVEMEVEEAVKKKMDEAKVLEFESKAHQA